MSSNERLTAHERQQRALAECVGDLRVRFAGIVDESSLEIVYEFFEARLADCADVEGHLEHLRTVVRELATRHCERLDAADDVDKERLIGKVIFLSTLCETSGEDPRLPPLKPGQRSIFSQQAGPETADTKAALTAWWEQRAAARAARQPGRGRRESGILAHRQRRAGERRSGRRPRSASTRSCARSGSSGDDPGPSLDDGEPPRPRLTSSPRPPRTYTSGPVASDSRGRR